MKQIVIAAGLVITLASSASAGQLTSLAKWRDMPELAQSASILGVIELTNAIGLQCQRPTSVGEYVAALKYRPFDVAKPWTSYVWQLFKENGCDIKEAKSDA
jgi:hypothetical protein